MSGEIIVVDVTTKDQISRYYRITKRFAFRDQEELIDLLYKIKTSGYDLKERRIMIEYEIT